jgi:hypothetical protein
MKLKLFRAEILGKQNKLALGAPRFEGISH